MEQTPDLPLTVISSPNLRRRRSCAGQASTAEAGEADDREPPPPAKRQRMGSGAGEAAAANAPGALPKGEPPAGACFAAKTYLDALRYALWQRISAACCKGFQGGFDRAAHLLRQASSRIRTRTPRRAARRP